MTDKLLLILVWYSWYVELKDIHLEINSHWCEFFNNVQMSNVWNSHNNYCLYVLFFDSTRFNMFDSFGTSPANHLCQNKYAGFSYITYISKTVQRTVFKTKITFILTLSANDDNYYLHSISLVNKVWKTPLTSQVCLINDKKN